MYPSSSSIDPAMREFIVACELCEDDVLRADPDLIQRLQKIYNDLVRAKMLGSEWDGLSIEEMKQEAKAELQSRYQADPEIFDATCILAVNRAIGRLLRQTDSSCKLAPDKNPEEYMQLRAESESRASGISPHRMTLEECMPSVAARARVILESSRMHMPAKLAWLKHLSQEEGVDERDREMIECLISGRLIPGIGGERPSLVIDPDPETPHEPRMARLGEEGRGRCQFFRPLGVSVFDHENPPSSPFVFREDPAVNVSAVAERVAAILLDDSEDVSTKQARLVEIRTEEGISEEDLEIVINAQAMLSPDET